MSDCIPMISKMVLTSESLATYITGKWSLVRVCALVNEKIVTLCKMTTTILADELFLCPEKTKKSIINIKLS
jgi:hypothetical protein